MRYVGNDSNVEYKIILHHEFTVRNRGNPRNITYALRSGKSIYLSHNSLSNISYLAKLSSKHEATITKLIDNITDNEAD